MNMYYGVTKRIDVYNGYTTNFTEGYCSGRDPIFMEDTDPRIQMHEWITSLRPELEGRGCLVDKLGRLV